MRTKVIIENKRCAHCGCFFNRRQQPNGRLEGVQEFLSRKYCTHECYCLHNTGVNNSRFVIGGTPRNDGYWRTSISGKRKYVHRIVAEQAIGRSLKSEEHVHHKDENKGRNLQENFLVLSNSQHRKTHAANQIRNTYGQFEGCPD